MSLILVVELDASRRDRILEALRRDDLEVETATSRAEALARAERSAPALLLASSATPEAPELLADFSRRRGGPGAVVVIDDPDETLAEDYPADEVLEATFSDDQVRQLVRRLLGSAPSRASGPVSSSSDAEQLTSEDIFGDVLAEVEADAGAARSASAARKSALPMADIERRLEETLSGVIPTAGKERRKAPKRRHRPPDTEIDDLLDQTLSSLDMPTRPRRPASSGAQPEAPATDRASAPASPPIEAAPPADAAPRAEDAVPPAEDAVPSAEDAAPQAEDVAPDEKSVETAEEQPAAPPTWSAPAFEAESPPPEPAPDSPPAAPPPAESSADDSPIEVTPAEGAGPWSAPPAGMPEPVDHFRTQALKITVPEDDDAGSDAPEADADGERFGDYTLLDRIAVGGMAEVWRARRRGVEGFQKTVAIKKILSNLTGSKDFVTMFIDEAKLAAQLSHNNIIQIYDLGKVGDDFFIAMEHVDGKDLRSILTAAQESNRPLPLGLALLVVSAVARALDYAHRKRDFDGDAMGLVHRDVSPQNVMISYEGSIKLCDFGIVKAVAKASTTQMGALKGKLQYMSPEQAWGKSVDARSDIFSLGAVFYELLTGRQLFSGDSEIGVLDAVRECKIRSPHEIEPSIPEEVAKIAIKTLAKSPDERYQTAGDLEHELREVLDDLRPTPSQKDLAVYMRSLFESSLSGPFALPAVSAAASEAEPPETPAAAQATAGTGTGAPAAATTADKPAGSGRIKWLVAAVVAVVLIGVGVLVVPSLTRRDAPATPGAGTPAAGTPAATTTDDGPPEEGTPDATMQRTATPDATMQRTATPAGGALETVSPAPLEGQDAATQTAESAEAGPKEEPGETESSVAGVDINQLVEQELSSRADQITQELEAQKRKLEQELAQAKAENESAKAKEEQGDGSPDDNGGDDGGGDDDSDPDDGDGEGGDGDDGSGG